MSEEDFDPDYTPRIVVLGAGPIGLETALYARYLGYEVALVERGTVANNVLRWGHVRMFSPFSMNRSSLGAAALRAQDENLRLPDDDALLTGREFADQYLLPLSRSDLLADCIHEGVEVLSVGRDGILKTDPQPGTELERSEFRFRVLVRLASGEEDVIDSDVVIDTTGVFDQPNSMGHGGIPAVGELACRDQIHWRVPDVLGEARSSFADSKVLVVGSGYSAATNVVALAELAKDAQTEVTWVTRRESPASGPIPVTEGDRLPTRSELAANANATDVRKFDQTSVLAVSFDDSTNKFTVTLGGKIGGTHEFDQIIANVGFRPDSELYRELQVETCSDSMAPAGVAAWLKQIGQVDAVDQPPPGAGQLVLKEPNFFVLGSKSFGRNSNFLLSLGLTQIRDAFTVIAGREDLDLYATMSAMSGR